MDKGGGIVKPTLLFAIHEYNIIIAELPSNGL